MNTPASAPLVERAPERRDNMDDLLAQLSRAESIIAAYVRATGFDEAGPCPICNCIEGCSHTFRERFATLSPRPASDVEAICQRLRGLLMKAALTHLVTDYISEDRDCFQEGWRLHDFPPDTHIAEFIADGIENPDHAKLIVEAVNTLPSLIDTVESLSGEVERLKAALNEAEQRVGTEQSIGRCLGEQLDHANLRIKALEAGR